MGASRRDRRAARLTSVRAVVFSIAWLAAGVIIRIRFRVNTCGQTEGGWVLAAYILLSAAIVVWAKLREGDVATEHERPYRALSRFIGLLALVTTLSACTAYLSGYEKCTD
jgi:hypothetical protein